MIEPLASDNFRIWKQTRIGLLSHPLDSDAARGHLAASTYLQMALKPHIYHIVGHTEAHNAATADDVIGASKIVRRAITNALGAPDMTAAKEVQMRKNELMTEAQITLGAIRHLAIRGLDAAWADAHTLAQAIAHGILDAPLLRNNKFGKVMIRTRIVDGYCVAVDGNNSPVNEMLRLKNMI